MFIVGLFTITKIWKQCIYSLVGKWIKKMGDIYMHTIEFYSDIKKKKSLNLAIFDNTDGPRRYWVK